MQNISDRGVPRLVPALLLAPALLLGTALLPGNAIVQPAFAQSDTAASATNGPKLSNDQPIQIESDKLEVNQKQNKATFTGNVNVVQGDTLLKAGRMVVYYVKSEGDDGKKGDSKEDGAKKSDVGAGGIGLGGASDIDHIEVDGKVYVKSQDQEATGDKGTFDMKTQILTLSGDKVVLTQGKNVVVGCKLVANLETGQSKLDGCDGGGKNPGRVKMLLTPSKKNGSE